MSLPGRAELYAARLRPRPITLLALAACACAAGVGHGQSSVDGALLVIVSAPASAPAPAPAAVGVSAAPDLILRSLDTAVETILTPARDGTLLLPQVTPGSYQLLRAGVPLGQAFEIAAGQTVTLTVSRQLALSLTSATPFETPAEPDQNADGLLTAGGLPATIGRTTLDGADLTQAYSGVAAGAGREDATDPDDDADTAERTTGPTHGLGRGRHAGAAYVLAAGAVREFRTSTLGYSAADAGGAGLLAGAVTRAGGRRFHGAASLRLRSSTFAAHDPDAFATSYAAGVVTTQLVKPHDLRERLGLTVSGPLYVHHQIYFLAAFDGQRRGFPAVCSPADPNFYSLTANQRALLGNRGVTVAATGRALTYLSSLTGEVSRRADQALGFGRVDWLEHPRAQLGLEATRTTWSAPAGLLEAPVVARGRASLGNASGSVDLLLARVTSAFTARTVNRASASFVRNVQYESAQTPLPQEPAIAAAGQVPEVNIGPNGLLFGTPAGLAQGAFPDERRAEFTDALTLVRGHHALQFGGQAAWIHERSASLQNGAGSFRYDTTANGAGGIVDFITDYTFNVNTNPNGGCPSIFAATHLFCFRSYTQSFGTARQAFSTADFDTFAQDSWRVRSNLSVQFGVRFTYSLLPLPQAPNGTLDAVFSARGASSVFPEDRNNFGPRAGFQWRAARGLTVRAGYGLFFSRLPGATISHALSDTAMASSTTKIRIRPSTELTCNSTSPQGFGYPCSLSAAPSGVRAQAANAVVFARNFRLPAVQQGSLLVERQIGQKTSVSAAYVVNLDRQLTGSVDLNIAPATSTVTYLLQGGTGTAGVRNGEAFTVPLYTARLTPGFGPVTAITSRANGSYNALVLAGETRALPQVLLRGGYTWSKAIDNGPNLSGVPRTSTQFDPFANGYDKGLSSLNYPWSTHVEAVWSPRVEASSRVLRALANGYTLSPLVSARAGRPYTLDVSGGTALSGGHESLNGSGGALYLPTVGRNTLRLPATVRADLRVARGFHAGPHAHAQVFAEALNVLNHRNVSSVNQRAYIVGPAGSSPDATVTPLVFQSSSAIAAEGLNTTAFGTVNAASTSTARERQVELGVSVSF